MSIHADLQVLVDVLEGGPEDDTNWINEALKNIIRKNPPTKPKVVTEWAVILERSGNIWNKYPSREAAQAFRDTVPDVDMYLASREVVDGGRSEWRRV